MWSLRAQACVESRELACSVRLRRIGLAEPPFLVSASVALHALQEAFCRLVENWLKTVNYGSCGAQMNRLNCSFSVFYHPDMGQEFWATMPYGIAILSSCFPPLCTILDPKICFYKWNLKMYCPCHTPSSNPSRAEELKKLLPLPLHPQNTLISCNQPTVNAQWELQIDCTDSIDCSDRAGKYCRHASLLLLPFSHWPSSALALDSTSLQGTVTSWLYGL